MLFMPSVVLLMLLALGIVSLPISGESSPTDQVISGARSLREMTDWEKNEISGPKFFHGSHELSFITVSWVPTSSGMFLNRGPDKIIRDIEKRIADFTFIPVENGEDFKFSTMKLGRNMTLTMISSQMSSTLRMEAKGLLFFLCICLMLKKGMGDALVFWSMSPDATLDPSSLHGGCPVIRGNKCTSTKWKHLEEYRV
ncbi:Prolyl 4-hydroxylase alpha-like protein [Quillaja saponaria]|uniref:Prolyl 4-hydroxylase alpha-like protein n=1 Tax=Quillaja saponaria TaxID=32244 RepID=A0AAD7LYL2_QUISA|nr:Prolyl 4-hydroxylase alpha-like protein [Quillaja saponaria]